MRAEPSRLVRYNWADSSSSQQQRLRNDVANEDTAFGKAEPGKTTVYDSKKTKLRRAARQTIPGRSTQESDLLTQ